MSSSNHYESGKITYRSRELATLAIFTFVAALISAIVMDFTVFPLTIFAVKNTGLFTAIIKFIIIFILFALGLYPIIRKIVSLKKNGFTAGAILTYLFKRSCFFISVFLVFIIISFVIIGLIYLLLYNNHLLLHRLLATI